MRDQYGSELPSFELGPVLVYYGGEDPIENMGTRPYKCPFHGDSTPSASVNTAEGWFNCHTYVDCPSGNAVQIIMKKEGVPYGVAVERAKEISRDNGSSVRGKSTRSSRMAGGARNRS